MDSHFKTIVITVPSIPKRDKLIKAIYTNLTKEPSVQFTIQQDKVNRIKVFHNAGKGIKVHIKTYLIIIIPVSIDLKPLDSIYGLVDFHLESTIKEFGKLMKKLTAIQGQRIVRAKTKNLEALLTGMLGEF